MLRCDPNVFSDGYLGNIDGSVQNGITNFYDETDRAITFWWNKNNSLFKPQPLVLGLSGGYFYDSSAVSGKKLGLVTAALRFVTDPSEAKAYVDQSLTGSIGSNSGVYGSVGDNQDEDSMGTDHGYEWNNPIQDSATFSFYNALMESYDLTPISMPGSP